VQRAAPGTATDPANPTGTAASPLETFSGWGRTAPTRAASVRPADAASVVALLRDGKSPRIARGLGRSYGDAAQCGGGVVIDTSDLSGIGPLDETAGTVVVGGGVSLHDVIRHVLPLGWFVAVTPGTRFVSVGGAIAADVHGKNHHRDGSFARHVAALTLATPSGVFVLRPDGEDRDLFWATAGGMGLTGVVVEATLRLIPVETSWMRVDTRRFTRLPELMGAMEDVEDAHRYNVAWLDCLQHRDGSRRSVLTVADHAPRAALPGRLRRRERERPGDPMVRVPLPAPIRLANRVSVRALNEAWFWKSTPRQSFTPLTTYFHPLDGIGGWNLLYGPDGFVQYQFVVPLDRADAVEEAVARIAASGLPSFLAVLKRFGPGTPGPLSFSQQGWTLALDFPVGPTGLPGLLDDLDELVAAAGGRVYLAKDARLRPDLLPAMYPRLGEMAALCRRVDPEGVLASDLSRRLGING
jgi:decaprenylphospho-beta-D-ribofuranose 2-oxidase